VGKPTGFMEFDRESARVRPPLERIRDWREERVPYDEPAMARQGARCMDCGTPFCHGGTAMAGIASGCPIGNLIPEWNDLVYRGRWREAAVRLHRTNDFPEFTGRVCPAPCEAACTLGIADLPVAVKSIERGIADRAWAEGWVIAEPPAVRTGRRVAVVGSGPAGLASANQLNRAGHTVTVFERADRPGGLLTWGIPSMKLDKSVVERRIRLMEEEGVLFVTGVEVGGADGAFTPEELRAEFHAVAICTGATVARDLDVPGRELSGVHLAMEFLTESARRVLGPDEPARGTSRGASRGPASLSAAGRRVVVIGGGDTGTDCVGTAVRQGAASVVQLEILPRPPVLRAPDNPWPQWPRVFRTDYGQEEAAALWGTDPRRFAVQTTRFVGDPVGRLAAVETVDVEWGNAAGAGGAGGDRRSPRPIEGTRQVIPADLALLALGFAGPEPALPRAFGCAIGDRGTVLTDPEGMSSVPGVFAAGDCSRGQSLVVWAIREGRRAARGIDRYLAGGESHGRGESHRRGESHLRG
jgi:glutamate synthase (NADPH/NADH) small chain